MNLDPDENPVMIELIERLTQQMTEEHRLSEVARLEREHQEDLKIFEGVTLKELCAYVRALEGHDED